jgi:hypothetical protein
VFPVGDGPHLESCRKLLLGGDQYRASRHRRLLMVRHYALRVLAFVATSLVAHHRNTAIGSTQWLEVHISRLYHFNWQHPGHNRGTITDIPCNVDLSRQSYWPVFVIGSRLRHENSFQVPRWLCQDARVTRLFIYGCKFPDLPLIRSPISKPVHRLARSCYVLDIYPQFALLHVNSQRYNILLFVLGIKIHICP